MNVFRNKQAEMVIKATIMLTIITTGILTILGTGGESTANFKTINVWPQFRCPTDDIRSHWTTSPATPIKITYEGRSEDAPAAGDYVISAAEANNLTDPAALNFKVDVSNGESRNFKIETINASESILRTGLHLSGTNRFKVDLPAQIWSDDIVVNKIEVVLPRSYQCEIGGSTIDIQWQFDKGTLTSGYMTTSNGYSHTFNSPVPAAGEWLYTIANPGLGVPCRSKYWGDKRNRLSPTISYTFSCKK